MDLLPTLERLAEEHLESMRQVPWDSFAQDIRRRPNAKGGGNYGFETDDTYFEVGDTTEWVDGADGDIRLTAYAFTFPQDAQEVRATCSAVIARPESPG